jgi:hypothetical protein
VDTRVTRLGEQHELSDCLGTMSRDQEDVAIVPRLLRLQDSIQARSQLG